MSELARQIENDISLFKDAGTNVEIKLDQDCFFVHITRDGIPRRYRFDTGGNQIKSILLADQSRRRFSSFASLLASSEFADLNDFRSKQRTALLRTRITDPIEPYGTIISGDQPPVRLTLDKMKSISESRNYNFIILDGPAGIGKTTLIERLVLARLDNQNSIPLLHVTSRGRRLSNLSDAFAGTIQHFRAKFVYSEVPILVKYRLIQVAIDGFDEFVDPDGYQDAWTALKDFIRESLTQDSCPLLLSGRDTFFDQNAFAAKLGAMTTTERIATARLGTVPATQAREWLIRQGWPSSDLDEEQIKYILRDGSYVLRPFFLSVLSKLRGFADIENAGINPQLYLLDSIIKREARLLEQPTGVEESVLTLGLQDVFQTISEDMAERESDSVAVSFVEFVADFCFESLVPSEVRRRLKVAMPTLPLLERGASSSEVRFTHTELQNRFLARRIIEKLGSEELVPPFLRRINCGMDHMYAYLDCLREVEEIAAAKTVQRLHSLITTENSSVRLCLNAAGLLLTSLSRPEIFDSAPLIIEFASVNDARLMGDMPLATLSDLQIARLDCRDADMTSLKLKNVSVATLVANDGTLLPENFDVNVGTIRLEFDDVQNTKILRDRLDVSEWVRRHKYTHEYYDDLPSINYFLKVCRAFNRQGYIRDSTKDASYYLLKDERWPALRSILESEGRFRVVRKDIAGPRDALYNLDNPLDLIRREASDPKVELIWRRVKSEL